MNRRALLNPFKKKPTAAPVLSPVSPCATSTSLAPFAGNWTYAEAAHLLRRAMFAPTHQQIQQAVQDGLSATLNRLLMPLPTPAPPLNPNNADDPDAPIGTTWVNKPFSSAALNAYRKQSLNAWTFSLLYNEGVHLREKMTLFWYNHFATEDINEPRLVFTNIALYRQYALGNFKAFTKAVTLDPAMLEYLNGRQNTAAAPNENYARELLELFTIGKGALIAPGDYTHYTEYDIQQMAKVLTGWRYAVNTSDPANEFYYAYFTASRHDATTKTLSAKFNSAVINNMGDQEYAHLIDIIFQQPEVARFISRKLYRYFVYYKIDDSIEQGIIQPMAALLIANNYEIAPALRALLESEHFYDVQLRGCMIKPPIEYVIGAFKYFNIAYTDNSNLDKYYQFYRNLFFLASGAQQTYYRVPSVAGWQAYYQEPLYYHYWISSVTLPARVKIANALTSTNGLPIGGVGYKIDPTAFIQQFDNPADPVQLLNTLTAYLFAQPLSAAQLSYLKNILLSGQSEDHYWTDAWNDFAANPTNTAFRGIVESRLRLLFFTLTNMSEYQLQ